MISISRGNSFRGDDIEREVNLVSSERRSSISAGTLEFDDKKINSLDVKTVGKSHLVELSDASLFNSLNSRETHAGDQLTIDTSKVIVSRRGPNSEIFDQVDRKNGHKYNWYPVLSMHGENLQGKNFYIRQDAFITSNNQIIETNGTNEEGRRLRFCQQYNHDYPCDGSIRPSDELYLKLDNKIEDIVKNNSDINKSIEQFCHQLSESFGGTWLSILYGSYASGNEKPGSDIDVMFSCDNNSYLLHKEALVPKITYFLSLLHEKVGANVDDEVPPESKHLISAEEMMEAVTCKVYYPPMETNGSTIAKVDPLSFFLDKEVDVTGMNKSESERFSNDFLKSKYLRLRLLFNIMTTPNQISSNRPDVVDKLQEQAKESLQLLSNDLRLQLGRSGHGTLDEQIDHLFKTEDIKGEYWLGYKEDRKGVKEKLIELLSSPPLKRAWL